MNQGKVELPDSFYERVCYFVRVLGAWIGLGVRACCQLWGLFPWPPVLTEFEIEGGWCHTASSARHEQHFLLGVLYGGRTASEVRCHRMKRSPSSEISVVKRVCAEMHVTCWVQ